MYVRKFHQLPVWQAARKLEQAIHECTNQGSFSADWKLRNQIEDAAASVMSNIAEGFSRRYDKEFVQFLFHAKSSAAEIQSHLYVALDRGHLDETIFKRKFELAEVVAKQLSGLISFLTGHKTRRTSSPSRPE